LEKIQLTNLVFDTVWISIKEKSQLMEDENVEEKVLSDWMFQSVEERRTDPSDGFAYTMDEFLKHYGGVEEWKNSTLWVAS